MCIVDEAIAGLNDSFPKDGFVKNRGSVASDVAGGMILKPVMRDVLWL